MKYKELYLYGAEKLKNAGVPEAELDARLLLEAVCHTTRNDMLLYPDKEVDEKQKENYVNRIRKREKRIPLQYILGKQEFMGMEFYVNKDVLIPRQDTEILVEEAMKHLHDGMHILDVCTGSGCILISLLHYSNDCQGVGIDISEAALAVAKENAARLLEDNKEEHMGDQQKISFWEGDLFDALPEMDKFDIIVSNPPYIETKVLQTLEPEVSHHEPLLALDGKEDGLYFYRRIVSESKEYLNESGMLLFEIGYDQGQEVSDMMKEAGFSDVCVIKDLARNDRVVYGML